MLQRAHSHCEKAFAKSASSEALRRYVVCHRGWSRPSLHESTPKPNCCGQSWQRDGKGKDKDKNPVGKDERNSDGSQSTSTTDPLNGVCRFHQKGKCRAGNSCSKVHNRPCRFANTKGGCSKGKQCPFPHCRPAAVSAEDGSGAQAPSSAGAEPGGESGKPAGKAASKAKAKAKASPASGAMAGPAMAVPVG